MNARLKAVSTLFFILLILWVFKSWFSFKPVTARDWFFLYPQNLKELSKIPQLWDNQGWGGLGRFKPYNWSFFYFQWPAKILSLFGLSWPVIEKIIWFWPYLVLGFFSSAFLFKTLFPKNKFWLFSPFLFLFNTFSLIITSGGQMGFAMAYALSPLVLALFIQLLTNSKINGLRSSILTGLILAFQMMLDPRVFYITMMAIGLYWVINLSSNTLKRVIPTLILPFLVVVGLNLFWLLPVLLTRRPVLPETYGEAGWVKFLSFARFSDALSLLHPFWPENIFGKTYFFRPEFLILPMLAFSSLLFTRIKMDRKRMKADICFFTILALVGAFLAKGNNPPFGEVYLWLFKNIPGMNMFRDPVKFYVLVAIGYSVLIPYSVEQVYKFLKAKH